MENGLILFRKDKDIRAGKEKVYHIRIRRIPCTPGRFTKHLQQSFAKLLPLLPPNPLKPRWTGPLKGWWHHLFLYRKKGCCHHFYPFLSQNVRKRGKRQEAEEDQTQGKEDGYGQTETGNRTGRTEPDEGQDIDRNLTGIRLRTARTTVAYSQSHSCNPAVSFCTHG